MSITLLIVAAAVAISAMCVIAVREAEPALASQDTAVGLADAAANTLATGGHRSSKVRDWQLTSVNNLTDATDLLDCLENQGIAERELIVLGNSSFAVRWR